MSSMMKFIYLFFVLFAFIITSCDEQTSFDDTYNDSTNLLPDSEDDDIQSDISCSCDSLNNNIGNKSGSRITFKEYHLSDGSVIFDDKPFDTLYNRYCNYATAGLYEGLEGCCVSFSIDYTDPPYVESFYSDSNCTNEISLLKLSSKPNTNDLVRINVITNEDEQEYMCGERIYKDVYALITTPTMTNVYVYDYDSCISWTEYVAEYEYENCHYLAAYKELTIDEARSLFVCTE
jgi:hypothetical protein